MEHVGDIIQRLRHKMNHLIVYSSRKYELYQRGVLVFTGTRILCRRYRNQYAAWWEMDFTMKPSAVTCEDVAYAMNRCMDHITELDGSVDEDAPDSVFNNATRRMLGWDDALHYLETITCVDERTN